MRENLIDYPAAPTIQRERMNCDATEIAARSCLAVDNTTTITLSSKLDRGGGVVATASVPVAVRPDTNFAWRSDPFAVNGGGSNVLNPRGDWLAAYWLGRLLDRDPTKNVLPLESPEPAPVPLGGVEDGGVAADGGDPNAEAAPSDDGGCGCSMQPSETQVPALVALSGVLGLAARRQRRRRTSGGLAP